MDNAQKAQRIAILPIEGFAMLSYSSVVEPLRAANLLSRKVLYDVVHVADTDVVKSSGAGLVACDLGLDTVGPFDVIFVVAGGDPLTFYGPKILDWLRKMDRKGAKLAGVSGGPAILAKAGLMDSKRMTVHWEHATALAEIVPNLLLERSLFVIDRDRITCAGGTAPLDLMYAIIAKDHGADLARAVSDWFMHTDIRPSGGPQRGGLVARVGTTSAPVVDAVEVMETHIADPLTLEQLASIAGVSSRQLNRLFIQKTKSTTMAYYRKLRLETADRLLTQSSMSITEIAFATGFGSSAHFSRVYGQIYGQPPSARKS
jgi:transcriptional regulator GlxA family with amidase domain